MNLNEFKAFVEGIEHAFGNGAPSESQWRLIKDMLLQVGQPSPEELERQEHMLAAQRKASEILSRTISREPSTMYGAGSNAYKAQFEAESG